jgi:hypothetical protein
VQGLKTKERAFQKIYFHFSKLNAAAAIADEKKMANFLSNIFSNVFTDKMKTFFCVFSGL